MSSKRADEFQFLAKVFYAVKGVSVFSESILGSKKELQF